MMNNDEDTFSFNQQTTNRSFAEGEPQRRTKDNKPYDFKDDPVLDWSGFPQLIEDVLLTPDMVRGEFAHKNFLDAPHWVRMLFLDAVTRYREVFFPTLEAKDQLQITQLMKNLTRFTRNSIDGAKREERAIITEIQGFIQKSLMEGGVGGQAVGDKHEEADFIDDAVNEALGQMFREQKDRSSHD